MFFCRRIKNYLVFQPLSSYFTSTNGKIGSKQSKGITEENIKPPSTTDNSFDSEKINKYRERRIKFKGIFLREDSISFIYGNVVNLYVAYKLNTWSRVMDLNTDFRLGNFFFAILRLYESRKLDKYGYNGYSTGFYARSQFSWSDGAWGKKLFLKLIIVRLDILIIKKDLIFW